MCEFIMNTPASSHMGGVWERQIRTIRSVLTSILEQSANPRSIQSRALDTKPHPDHEIHDHLSTSWKVCQGRSVPPQEMAQSSTLGQQLLDTVEEGIPLKSSAQTEVDQGPQKRQGQWYCYFARWFYNTKLMEVSHWLGRLLKCTRVRTEEWEDWSCLSVIQIWTEREGASLNLFTWRGPSIRQSYCWKQTEDSSIF